MAHRLTCGQFVTSTVTSEASPASCTAAPADSAARPKRAIRRGANSEPAKNSRAIGTIARPPWKASACSPFWTVRAKTNMKEPNPMLKASTMTRPRDIDGSRSSDGGRRGTSPRASARFSTV